jgi:hypothetical protein
MEGINEIEIKKMLDDYVENQEFNNKQKEFIVALEEYFEIPKTEIFLALKKEQIKAYGRFIKDENDYDLTDFIEIEKNEWKQNKIDWERSTLEVKDGKYIHILIDVPNLFKLFSEPEMDTASNVFLFNGTYFSDENNLSIFEKKRTGRPAFNWKEFTEEMALRLINGTLPKLQKSCIIDMQKWCFEKWGKVPSETNLKEHISPFYSAKKSKN